MHATRELDLNDKTKQFTISSESLKREYFNFSSKVLSKSAVMQDFKLSPNKINEMLFHLERGSFLEEHNINKILNHAYDKGYMDYLQGKKFQAITKDIELSNETGKILFQKWAEEALDMNQVHASLVRMEKQRDVLQKTGAVIPSHLSEAISIQQAKMNVHDYRKHMLLGETLSGTVSTLVALSGQPKAAMQIRSFAGGALSTFTGVAALAGNAGALQALGVAGMSGPIAPLVAGLAVFSGILQIAGVFGVDDSDDNNALGEALMAIMQQINAMHQEMRQHFHELFSYLQNDIKIPMLVGMHSINENIESLTILVEETAKSDRLTNLAKALHAIQSHVGKRGVMLDEKSHDKNLMTLQFYLENQAYEHIFNGNLQFLYLKNPVQLCQFLKREYSLGYKNSLAYLATWFNQFSPLPAHINTQRLFNIGIWGLVVDEYLEHIHTASQSENVDAVVHDTYLAALNVLGLIEHLKNDRTLFKSLLHHYEKKLEDIECLIKERRKEKIDSASDLTPFERYFPANTKWSLAFKNEHDQLSALHEILRAYCYFSQQPHAQKIFNSLLIESDDVFNYCSMFQENANDSLSLACSTARPNSAMKAIKKGADVNFSAVRKINNVQDPIIIDMMIWDRGGLEYRHKESQMIDVLDVLLQQPNINQEDVFSAFNAAQDACRFEVQLLLELFMAFPTTYDFYHAVIHDNQEKKAKLIIDGIDSKALLWMVSILGCWKVYEALPENEIDIKDIEILDSRGFFTPLRIALTLNRKDVVLGLIAKGAELQYFTTDTREPKVCSQFKTSQRYKNDEFHQKVLDKLSKPHEEYRESHNYEHMLDRLNKIVEEGDSLACASEAIIWDRALKLQKFLTQPRLNKSQRDINEYLHPAEACNSSSNLESYSALSPDIEALYDITEQANTFHSLLVAYYAKGPNQLVHKNLSTILIHVTQLIEWFKEDYTGKAQVFIAALRHISSAFNIIDAMLKSEDEKKYYFSQNVQSLIADIRDQVKILSKIKEENVHVSHLHKNSLFKRSAPIDCQVQSNQDQAILKTRTTNNKNPSPLFEWYSCNDILQYLDSAIKKDLGGFSANCKYFLNNQFKDLDDRNYSVAVIDAIDTNGGIPMKFFFDSSEQQKPDSGMPDDRYDLFDEINRLVTLPGNQNIKILFAHNITNVHWLCAEITIHKTGDNFNISMFAHDPYGGGSLNDKNYNELVSVLRKKIKQLNPNANMNFSRLASPYGQRQSHDDANSCGVIVVEDILKRIQGESLDIPKPYPVGAQELREKHQIKNSEYKRACPLK